MSLGKKQNSVIWLALAVLFLNTATAANAGWNFKMLGGIRAARTGISYDRKSRAISAYNQAVQMFAARQSEGAKQNFRIALQLDPSLYMAHAPLGQLLFADGAYQEAITELRAAVHYDPSSAPCWCMLGISYSRINDQANAAEAFQRYLSYDPYGSYAGEARRSLSILKRQEVSACADDHSTYVREFGGVPRKWHNDGAPFRVYVTPGEDVPGFTQKNYEAVEYALNEWTNISDGRVRFQFVDRLENAQITVSWTGNPREFASSGELGLTRTTFNARGEISHAQVRLLTKINSATSDREKFGRARAVALHEMGHALGLHHSERPSDVMYPMVAPIGMEFSPSARDKNTLLSLYR